MEPRWRCSISTRWLWSAAFLSLREYTGLLLKINARELKVEQRWPTAPCASPCSMAMDRVNRRLFLGCRSHVMAVVDADSGKVITTLPIGDHVDATAFDTETKLIFNSNGE